ncbi:MAG: hypothetical protein A2Y17_12335 [Clostridiales bacterium GWF2_38_85]|nr:MAG: hypothetical protein A2Y17_12335 [Clostridiales bacterium GWF2_38_85]
MQVLKAFTLDITRTTPLEYIYAKQGDVDSRVLEIELLNSGEIYTIPATVTARFRLKKKDGTQCLTDCTIADNKISATLTEQMLAVEGIAVAEIALYDSDGSLITSQTFYIKVEKYTINPPQVTSSDEYKSLTAALTRVAQVETIANTAEAQSETALENLTIIEATINTATDGANTAAQGANTAATLCNNAVASLNNKAMKKYTVTFTGSLSAGTRADDAVGMVANVAVDGATVVNNFDGVSFFNRPICCCTWDATARKWKVNAYRGEPNFAWDGTNGELMYECTPFYYKTDLNTYVSVTATPSEGYALAPMFKDGNTKVYCPVFPLAMVNGVATSRSGYLPQTGSLDSFMTNCRTFDSKAHTETIEVRFSEYVLQLVEFATKDVQTVMMGACNMRYNGDDIIASVISDTSFTTTSAIGALFKAGQTISIGSAKNGEQRTSGVVITSITTVDTVSTFVLASAVANLAIGDYLSSRCWINGATNIVTASSGSPVSNTDGFRPCIWRGNALPWANGFSTLCNVLVNRTGAGTTESPYVYKLWYLSDPSKYNAGAITADYIEANFNLATADGYVKTLKVDTRYPFLMGTAEIGGASTTYAAAYYYIINTPAVRAVRVGGRFSTGRACSPVYFYVDLAPSYSYLFCLARLFVSP